MGRDTARDGLRNKLRTFFLTKFGWFWTLMQSLGPIKRWWNAKLLNGAIKAMPYRPEPLCNQADYTTWEGLSNRKWSSRHLPPQPQGELPDAKKVAEDLFGRTEDEFRPSKKSTLVFPYFAQWFVDGFLVGDKVDRRRNLSNHHIDLCQLYGLHPEVTRLIRDDHGGRLKSQQIDGKGEYAPFLFGADGRIKPEYSKRRSTYNDFVDIANEQILVEMAAGEVNRDLLNKKLTDLGARTSDGVVLPRHFAYNEIPRRQKLFDDEGDYEKVKNIFAIANDRGNATPAFTMMSTLMLREHNRIAGILDKKYGWDSDRTFETTRNILIVILLRIVVEEYINHIAPYHFKFFVDPEKFHKPLPWKAQNWMTTEFQLLYRWHPMVPDALQLGDRKVSSLESLWNPGLMLDVGLANMFQYATNQPAGEIGPKNTWHWMIDNAEVPSIKMGRHCRLASYNDYREICGMPRVTSFDQITANEQAQKALAENYGTVDRIEFYTGLFCEDVRENSALAPLIGVMVGVDAFSQALPNPLLAKRIWNKDTFSPRGWEIIHEETHTVEALLKRNTPELSSQERDQLSISMTRSDWVRQ